MKRNGLDWERRERDRDIWFGAKLDWTSNIYIYIYIENATQSRYQGGIDNKKIYIDWGGIEHLSRTKSR